MPKPQHSTQRSLLAGLSALTVLVAVIVWQLTAPLPASLPLPLPEDASAPDATRSTPRQPLFVTFLDVGQGDAALVQAPSGRTLLIDGGDSRDDAAQVILPALKAIDCQRLDFLVITHPDQDHIGGLPYLVDSLPISHVVLTGQVHTTSSYERLLTLVRDKRISVIKARSGGRLDLDPSVTVAILGPDDTAVEKEDTNNASVVIRVTYAEVSILFAGDAEEPEEKAILSSGAGVRAQVLKVAHHGSQSASSLEWLRAVSPEVAVISVAADSPHEHPHYEVLQRLEQAGVTIYRTDQHGSILVRSDGNRYQAFTEH